MRTEHLLSERKRLRPAYPHKRERLVTPRKVKHKECDD